MNLVLRLLGWVLMQGFYGKTAADYPEKYHNVIRRLQKAALKPTLEEVMELEDECIDELNLREQITEAALQSARKAKEEKEKERMEKERLLQVQDASVRRMAQSGIALEDILKMLELSVETVKRNLKED